MIQESGVAMEAWIIYFKKQAEYNRQYIEFYREEGAKLGICVKLILVEKLQFGVLNNRWFIRYENTEIKYPDFIINRAIYPLLSRQLEMMGLRVFNNSFIAEICNNKAKTYQYLAKTGIPMIDTIFCKNILLRETLMESKKPCVVKAVEGHGGKEVFLLEDNDDNKINHILGGIGSSDTVIQPLIGSRHQDLRVYVIGKKIIAGVLRTAREGSFQSNYSLGGEVALYELSEQEREQVNIIIKEFDFGLVGIDFIIGDEGELIFNEIEDVVGSRMLYQCADINIVESYLKHIRKLISATRNYCENQLS